MSPGDGSACFPLQSLAKFSSGFQPDAAMAIRAENDPGFSRKFLIMGIVAVGFALWCVKDGAISYPQMRARGFAEYRKQHPLIEQADPAEFEAQATGDERGKWQEFAETYGFKTGPEIVMQFLIAVLTGA